MVWIVWNANNLRLMEERFALGLRFEAVSLRRWRFEARGKENRGLHPLCPTRNANLPPTTNYRLSALTFELSAFFASNLRPQTSNRRRLCSLPFVQKIRNQLILPSTFHLPTSIHSDFPIPTSHFKCDTYSKPHRFPPSIPCRVPPDRWGYKPF